MGSGWRSQGTLDRVIEGSWCPQGLQFLQLSHLHGSVMCSDLLEDLISWFLLHFSMAIPSPHSSCHK